MKASQLLVQISDTHLGADPGYDLRGVNTRDSLQAVINAATGHLNVADHIIVTGDISHDETAASYAMIRDKLSAFDGQKSWLPGNHDNLKVLHEVFANAEWPGLVKLGGWCLIGLNSLVAGQEGGYLDDAQLQELATRLDDNKSQPTVVALHHPPISIQSPWMDNISLKNQRAFQEILSQHQQVRAVIFGHAHQEFDVLSDGIRWLCCPSTCLQFLPKAKVSASDDRLPGYRWLRLFGNGTLETGVERIETWPAGSEPNR